MPRPKVVSLMYSHSCVNWKKLFCCSHWKRTLYDMVITLLALGICYIVIPLYTLIDRLPKTLSYLFFFTFFFWILCFHGWHGKICLSHIKSHAGTGNISELCKRGVFEGKQSSTHCCMLVRWPAIQKSVCWENFFFFMNESCGCPWA